MWSGREFDYGMSPTVRKLDSDANDGVGGESDQEWPAERARNVVHVLIGLHHWHLQPQMGARAAHRTGNKPQFRNRECHSQRRTIGFDEARIWSRVQVD